MKPWSTVTQNGMKRGTAVNEMINNVLHCYKYMYYKKRLQVYSQLIKNKKSCMPNAQKMHLSANTIQFEHMKLIFFKNVNCTCR